MTPDLPTHLRVHQFAGLSPGPRLIVLGAVHGNETCGTRAIERVLAELERGQWRVERGTLTLVPVANPLAYAQGTRMGERNLNRCLHPAAEPRCFEDGVANVLCPLLAAHDVLLDLHSFRGPGEPFVMLGPWDNDGPLEPFAQAAAEARFAAHLGPTRVVEGWLKAYASGAARRRARGLGDDDPSYGVGTTEYLRSRGGYGVTLECGPHGDPAAAEVGWHALRQAVALLGLADLPLVPPPTAHEVLRLTAVVDREHEGDRFVRPWASFDAVQAGETIGWRHDGAPVRAASEGRVVFPDAAAAPGHEWFYLAVPSGRRIA